MEESRLDALISAYDKADAVRQSLIEEKTGYLSRLSEVEEYLAYKDEVTEALLSIQREMQSGTTDSYEALLTELLHMVMPNDPANHRVVMSHYIKNNSVSLKTEIETREGYRHDIYEDKGQSVENIMALCLRFLALGRTANRRVLFFDESDHGVMPAYMGRFSEVLYHLTYRVGMQVVYISHHDWKLFEGKARIIELTRDGDSISANVISEPDPNAGREFSSDVMDYMSGIGISDISLKNYKAHADTVVELSPFLNVIIGHMDLGKSSIISAIDALKRNTGSIGKIRDGQRELSVEIGIEEGRRLAWSYSQDTPKKAKYLLYEADGSVMQVHEGAKNPPAFLDDYLVMPTHHGYDLHIADSHDSSFIFAKHVTEAKAAELLSFDDETTQAQDMLTQHKDNIVAMKKEQKQIHTAINKVKSKLSVMAHLDKIDVTALREARLSLRKNREQEASGLIEVARRLREKEKRLAVIRKLSDLPSLPERKVTDSESAEKLSRSISGGERAIGLMKGISVAREYPNKPGDGRDAEQVLKRISPLEARLTQLEKINSPAFPHRPEVNELLGSSLEKISEHAVRQKVILQTARDVESEIRKTAVSIKNSIHENGGVCPLCQHEV